MNTRVPVDIRNRNTHHFTCVKKRTSIASRVHRYFSHSVALAVDHCLDIHRMNTWHGQRNMLHMTQREQLESAHVFARGGPRYQVAPFPLFIFSPSPPVHILNIAPGHSDNSCLCPPYAFPYRGRAMFESHQQYQQYQQYQR